jgi:hypothetical protein
MVTFPEKPEKGIFRDSVPFWVKMRRSESVIPMKAVSLSRVSKITLAASRDRVWPLRPGFPPHW